MVHTYQSVKSIKFFNTCRVKSVVFFRIDSNIKVMPFKFKVIIHIFS